MYGFNHLPLAQRAIQVDEFSAGGYTQTASGGYETYKIPSGATFLYVVLVGSAGKGGDPVPGAAIAGGGGGGSSSITKGILPVFLLPQVLYVAVPAQTITGNGLDAKILIRPSTSADDCIISAPGGGQGASAGTAGSAGTGFSSGSGKWSGTLALWVSQVGAAGGAGSTTNGAAVTALATLPLTGGGGGGGSSAGTGGNITGAGPFPTISGGASGLNPGKGGMMLRQPFGGVGGSGGGGSNAAGTGANFGGPGAIGCGGGGGGNAASGTAGASGKGGPGYCLIVAF